MNKPSEENNLADQLLDVTIINIFQMKKMKMKKKSVSTKFK